MKNLKKILGVFVCLFVMSSLGMVTHAQNMDVAEMVKTINANCPQQLSSGMVITQVSFSENTVLYEVVTDTIVDTPEVNQAVKESLVSSYSQAIDQDPLLWKVVDDQLNMQFHFVGEATQNEMTIVVTGAELVDACSLATLASAVAKACPMAVGDGATMVNVLYQDPVVEVVTELDPAEYDPIAAAGIETVKEGMLSAFSLESLEEDPVMERVYGEKKNLKNTYVKKGTQESLSFVLTYEEMKAACEANQ